jgi:hypothetical protein
MIGFAEHKCHANFLSKDLEVQYGHMQSIVIFKEESCTLSSQHPGLDGWMGRTFSAVYLLSSFDPRISY